MYVHYGCRCEACCKAEHEQYLKRQATKKRKRTNSKWGEPVDCASYEVPHKEYVRVINKREIQRAYNFRRYWAIKSRPATHSRCIHWTEIAEKFGMKCSICGCTVDPNDMWVGSDGRKRFGRKYPTVDHIVAIKNGGTDTLDNVQLTCKHCNSSKGAKRYENAVGE